MKTKIRPLVITALGLGVAVAGALGVLAGQSLAHRSTIKRDAFAEGYATYARDHARRLG